MEERIKERNEQNKFLVSSLKARHCYHRRGKKSFYDVASSGSSDITPVFKPTYSNILLAAQDLYGARPVALVASTGLGLGRCRRDG